MSVAAFTATLPVRDGHFLLESGLHARRWLDLDGLFVDQAALAPQLDALAALLSPHRPTAVCGPLLGGAFVAQALGVRLGLRCYVAERSATVAGDTLYGAVYRLPGSQRRRVDGERVALVDDVISAGSSVRAVAAELAGLGAHTVVVGALLVLGDRARAHFDAIGVPLVAPSRDAFESWEPAACPCCRAGMPLTVPGDG